MNILLSRADYCCDIFVYILLRDFTLNTASSSDLSSRISGKMIPLNLTSECIAFNQIGWDGLCVLGGC